MTDEQLQALLHRCETGEASADDLLLLEACLAEPETGGWSEVTGTLQRSLAEESAAVDVASQVIEDLAPADSWPAVARAVRESAPDAVEIAPSVLERVGEGAEARRLQEALSVFRLALGDEADDVECASAVLEALQVEADGERAEALERSFDALQAGLAAEAVGLDLVEGVMRQVTPEQEPVLERALLALAAGLEAEALGVDVREAVVGKIVGEATELDVLSALADGELSVEHRSRVSSLLQTPHARATLAAWLDLGWKVRQAVHAEVEQAPVEPLWPAVARELGLESLPGQAMDLCMVELRDGLHAASVVESVADEVMAEILPPPVRHWESGDIPTAERVSEMPAPAVSWWRRIPVLSMVAGAVALVLILDMTRTEPGDVATPDSAVAAADAFQIADVNTTEIADLSVGEGAMVQVLQPEEGAPMVIFIEESGGAEGVTL